MNTNSKWPHEYRIPVSQDHVRNLKNPHLENLTVIHAFVKVKDLPNRVIPDKINPRSHEVIKMKSGVPLAITETIENDPDLFHLLNRGCLILAKKAWYDNKERTLHFSIESDDEHGMVDGATTDRVIAELKSQISNADFLTLKDDEIPDNFKELYIHLEIIAGDIDSELRIKLASARNTSLQVKEFSLEDLKGNFDWLKDVIEKSQLKGRIRYRENEPAPVDVRTVLALLTLFHPRWNDKKTDPIIAYTGKGAIIENYQNPEWLSGYKEIAPVVIDILRLYDHIHVNFQEQYMKAYGTGSKLGRRREVRFIEAQRKAKILPLTQSETHYVIPDGWLYPLLGSFRVLLKEESNKKESVDWKYDPFKFFDKFGSQLIPTIVGTSEELGSNPNAVGKSKRLWEALRDKVENRLFHLSHEKEITE